MVKHTQAIILSVLYHFVGLAFKELRVTLGPTHAHQTLNYIYLFIYLFIYLVWLLRVFLTL